MTRPTNAQRRQRKQYADLWRTVAESADKKQKYPTGLCGLLSEMGYDPNTTARQEVRLFAPCEQWNEGEHCSLYYWPVYTPTDKEGRYAGARRRDRVLAALFLAAMAETGDITNNPE